MIAPLPEKISSLLASLRKLPLLRSIAQGIALVLSAAIIIPPLVFGSLFISGPLTQEKTIIVTHGESAAEIGAQLSRERIVYLAAQFRLAARFMSEGYLKTGEYAIPAHASAIDIVTMMHEGRSVVRLFTVAEGLTSFEVVNLLNEDPTLTGTIASIPPDGSLLPESYRYTYGDSRAGLIGRMQKAMLDKTNEIWATRDPDLPLKSEKEAVTLASIVEKETGKTDERTRIAGVFYNRLRLNMRLQSDPTVIYALTKGKQLLNRALVHDDLAVQSPFNTYASDGLPPHAICNPGVAALQAVAHPDHHHFLYFVANGTGGHAFAPDLATHNENINRWHQFMNSSAARP